MQQALTSVTDLPRSRATALSEMATPEEHTAKGVLPTPTAFAGASTGAAAFQNWLEEEEEEWRLERMLEAKCPKEFICPISLDIMADPVILVETGMMYDRHNIRKWLLLGGSTCPLTGVKLVTRKVVSHKHLRQRIDRWVATGGSPPAESAATLAEGSRMCASEASYQVLSQGPARADSCALPDSPRAESVATSAGQASTVRRRAWLFERTPSEASSMGLPRQHSRRHGAPHGAALTPARQPQPNVSRSSMLLCKFSSSALSKITAGSSRATTPMASPRSAGEQEDASIQPDKVDVPSSKGPTNLSATKATSVPPEVAEHVSVKQSGTAASAPAASRGDATAVARPTHHTIHAPPSTPKTPAAIGNHAEDGASRHQAAQQEEEGQAADWTVFSAQGLHMDQSMLAQAHAAMLTIESEGWIQEPETLRDDEGGTRQCLDPGVGEQTPADKQMAEEAHGQSCTDTAAATAAPEQEGEDAAQDQSEVLAALEEALADNALSSKELIVAADPGATGGSYKSSSTGSANISVIATADMVVRRPRNRVSCLGVGLQPRRSAGGRRQIAPGTLHTDPAPTPNRQPSAPSRHRRDGSVTPLQKPQTGPAREELIILPPRAQSRAAYQGSGWARCFGCNVPPSLRARGDRSGAASRAASARVDHWVEGSDEEIVTMDDFARHVIAAAAKQDAAAAAESCAPKKEAATA